VVLEVAARCEDAVGADGECIVTKYGGLSISYCPKPGHYAVLSTQGMPLRVEPEVVFLGFLKQHSDRSRGQYRCFPEG